MAKFLTAANISLLYNVVGMMPFGLMSADMVLEVWPSVTRETCTKGGWGGGKDTCVDSLEFTVGKIYLQVMFGVSMLYSMQLIFSGKMAYLASMGCMAATMIKHVTVDGLIPPPPVIGMTALTILAILASDVWGKRAFIGFCFFNALTFIAQPLMVLQDSFPDVVAGSKEAKLGAFCFEVISLYLVMAGLTALIPMKAYGLALASQVGLAVVGKHVLVDKSGPPTPMIFLWIATTLLAWKEYGWVMKPACDKAIKKGPQKVHGMIVGSNFVPYFILEAIGGSMPMVGLASIDSSYAYTGATAMLCGMLAIFLTMSAYSEYTEQMDGKMFAIYHYFLSVVVFLWQCQSSTSLLGVMFFAAPHMFTTWTIYLVVTNSPNDKKD